ncbi:MAG: hypothetical protein JSS66_06850 [Armatimonadetes bacterium]|nr:hypothetical protein [Armatimonadota bacterium]
MDAAFGKIDDCYIGNEDDAKHLVDEKGLAPERAAPDKNVCSIGYCSKEKKWFGYSHRAMKGFGIGDKAEEWYPDGENKGKKPAKTLADAKQMAIDFAESVS